MPTTVKRSGDPHALAKVLRAGRVGVSEDNRKVRAPVERALKTKLSHPGMGHVYRTRFFVGRDGRVHPIGTRVPHRASKPFSPPAKDTGALFRSVGSSSSRLVDGAEASFYSTSPVAVYTEFGTRGNLQRKGMAPRPWFRPVMFKMRLDMAKPWIDGIERRERFTARALRGTTR